MNHPISLDVFEDNLYWVSRDNGDIWRQDKFGRGVKVRTKHGSQVNNAVKVFHPLRYNISSKL